MKREKVLGEEKNPVLTNFTRGIDVNKLMYKEEIRIQKAWASQLAKNKCRISRV